MPRSRSRSRSPKRERKRSRSRSRDRHRRHRRSRSRSPRGGGGRHRSRSRSPRYRSRSRERRPRDRDRRKSKKPRQEEEDEEFITYTVQEKPTIGEEEIQAMPEEEQDLMRVMGFTGFDTTKNKQVVGNDHYAANIAKKRRYRQYMNRRGGFNRPLDFIA